MAAQVNGEESAIMCVLSKSLKVNNNGGLAIDENNQQVPLSQIVQKFCGEMCGAALEGKPKLFFHLVENFFYLPILKSDLDLDNFVGTVRMNTTAKCFAAFGEEIELTSNIFTSQKS